MFLIIKYEQNSNGIGLITTDTKETEEILWTA